MEAKRAKMNSLIIKMDIHKAQGKRNKLSQPKRPVMVEGLIRAKNQSIALVSQQSWQLNDVSCYVQNATGIESARGQTKLQQQKELD